ncbi:type II secretion system protein [Parashewanella curva]|uniref:Type II secretion system protein n=1 Tax=Parashewanella curva TaxID=2338552 RepID=A0A3L8PWQ2_9GAMM|nr:prepilin-type N-terminal cleavage/methylation domain-containing protein [Parashewanella curva]RLV59043.1 type II secretion system protein [Parashewanella curva]
MKQKQQGFTLIELVVVIIILGILAVTAAPKFISFQQEARVGTLNGLEGAIRSANSLVHSRAQIATPVAIDNVNVPLSAEYIAATAVALNAAMDTSFGVAADDTDWVVTADTPAAGSIRIMQRGAPTNCHLDYTQARAASAQGVTPVVTAAGPQYDIEVSGCN